jgi:cytochrome bd ubiquinol oxidase subunit I
LTLFAVGVITGTVFSFEMGLLWPNFMGTFGSVFGLGFAIEGFSFFVEASFIGIYAGSSSPGTIIPRAVSARP